MENGLLILGIIALLFLSMYGFAYGSVALEKIKYRKQSEEQERLEAIKQARRQQRQLARNEKLEKLRQRSEQIRVELNRLEKVNLQSTINEHDIVEKMKERMDLKQNQAAS
jgi:activator of 2-hydroxyglutaryl-CoA dehydratase